MTAPLPLGFIGLGRMGQAMAARLVACGHAVLAYDLNPSACDALVKAGGRIAASARAVADEAAIVFACLPSAAASQAVAAEAAAGSAIEVYVETSTLGQAVVEQIAATLQTQGVQMLDAPISGGPDAAAQGKLSTVVSGPAQAREQARGAIASYAGTIVDAGARPGLAQVFKLVNQGITFASFLLTSEAVTAGVKAGADAQALLDFVNASTGRNWSTAVKFPQSVLARRFGEGTLAIIEKDLELFAQLCRRGNVPATLSDEARRVFAQARETLPAPVDLAATVQLYERAAGTIIAARNPR